MCAITNADDALIVLSGALYKLEEIAKKIRLATPYHEKEFCIMKGSEVIAYANALTANKALWEALYFASNGSTETFEKLASLNELIGVKYAELQQYMVG